MTLQIRPNVYRGEMGYTLSGYPVGQQGGWPLRIFFASREAAERYRVKTNARAKVGRRYMPLGARYFQPPCERLALAMDRRLGLCRTLVSA